MPLPKAVLQKNGFTFKQFFIAHDKCAMKVGTDGILLGAWAPVQNVSKILDIGTGSGLLALMLAQRTNDSVKIDAVEIDEAAAKQAKDNVDASAWSERIHIYQADIREWAQNINDRYDLIVSNPPYFQQGLPCSSSSRSGARYTITLNHNELLSRAMDLLTDAGFLCVVLPESTGRDFMEQASKLGWYIHYRMDISETETRLPHRVLIALSRQPGELFDERLVIRDTDRQYSNAFCSLTSEFYLFM